MPQINPPKYVRQILFGLQARGHLAYLVGGCVRDVIMDITPQDWDICTSALPEEVMELFPGSRPTGLEHGTVTVIMAARAPRSRPSGPRATIAITAGRIQSPLFPTSSPISAAVILP